MAFQKKPLPPASFNLVFKPQSDTDHRHFEGALDAPFDPMAVFSRVNAWWLAEASLLSYWDTSEAQQQFNDAAALDSVPIGDGGTQGYVAWRQGFTLVAFRGTEADSIRDMITDARFALVQWDKLDERVHDGFRDGLDRVWCQLLAAIEPLADRPIWFTGHSLGGALATLAADRFVRERAHNGLGDLGGVYTFGSPLVGDRRFVDGFNNRVADRSFRFVNDQDAVTRVPPPLIGYRHVNTEHFLGANDPSLSLSEPLIDHTPRRYAVLAWNSFVDAAVA
jgi:triacylglycerol lipase